uniref:kanadaptin n=1 Tax=Erigeron canadensis TaxID=72917 RepID=UPI001CB9116C|nr:kanadaptin [Erigeron canadensis]
MTSDMMPPPPPRHLTTTADQPPSTESPPIETPLNNTETTLMPPPPPIPQQQVNSDTPIVPADEDVNKKPSSNAVPYTIPSWSEPPCHNYYLEVLKEGSIIDQFHVYEKGAYMFGRVDLCDFVLEHPTISRFHAVIQYNKSGDAFLYDLSSTHGTFKNKNQVKQKVYVELHVGDVLQFGLSSRLYIFQGPSELMPPEKDLKSIRSVKMGQERRDMEASLRRAKREAALADGISWGMDEDAFEENEDDLDEITWQTFKGQLTEKQEKTREKVLKRLEKIANMKKEIDAIRAKDISQGGLTQGQQTQIARNEQRMAQVLEELENLEETLNESIRESLGARGGRVHGKKKGAIEDDEDEYMSDEDDFYDRTRKRSSKQKGADSRSVETADSLLDKKDILSRQIEEKKKFLDDEKNRAIPEKDDVAEAGDELDAFMTGLSSQLVHDKANSIQKELDELQSELERVQYLLKIADPAGEASRKRESIASEGKPNISIPPVVKKPFLEKQKNTQKQINVDVTIKASKNDESSDVVTTAIPPKAPVYTITKPQWLGAPEKKEEKKPQEVPLVETESDQFVDYKDRKEVLVKNESAQVNVDLGLADIAPGLHIRKRKQVEEPEKIHNGNSDSAEASGGVDIASEAVALLLKHTKGIQAIDDEEMIHTEGIAADSKGKKGKKKAKKVLGPEKPSFLDSEAAYESWVPPEGQSGDGRTSLNDRFGY